MDAKLYYAIELSGNDNDEDDGREEKKKSVHCPYLHAKMNQRHKRKKRRAIDCYNGHGWSLMCTERAYTLHSQFAPQNRSKTRITRNKIQPISSMRCRHFRLAHEQQQQQRKSNGVPETRRGTKWNEIHAHKIILCGFTIRTQQ